jgi:hypothetical protein
MEIENLDQHFKSNILAEGGKIQAVGSMRVSFRDRSHLCSYITTTETKPQRAFSLDFCDSPFLLDLSSTKGTSSAPVGHRIVHLSIGQTAAAQKVRLVNSYKILAWATWAAVEPVTPVRDHYQTVHRAIRAVRAILEEVAASLVTRA